MESVSTCQGCHQPILACDKTMNCNVCGEDYDLTCAGFTENQYDSATAEFVLAWMCVSCRSKLPKSGNINTPVRQMMGSYGAHEAIDKDETIANVSIGNLTGDFITFRAGQQSSQQQQAPCKCQNTASIRTIIREELKAILNESFISSISKQVAQQIAATKDPAMHKITAKLDETLTAVEKVLGQQLIPASKEQSIPKDIRHTLRKQPVLADKGKSVNLHTTGAVSTNTKTSPDPIIVGDNTIEKKGKSETLWAHYLSAAMPKTAPPTSMISLAIGEPSVNEPERDNIQRDGPWTEVRRGRARASLPGVLRGTAAPGATALRAAERVKHLHLYYVQEGTSVEQVRAHLNSVCGDDVCSVEVLKARGNYASFKLGVPSKLVEQVLDAENWAEDICIKHWRQSFRRSYDKGERQQ